MESFPIKTDSKPRTVEETTTEEEIRKVHAELERLKSEMAKVVQDYLERRQIRLDQNRRERYEG